MKIKLLLGGLLCCGAYWLLSDRESSTTTAAATAVKARAVTDAKGVADYYAYEEDRQQRIQALKQTDAEARKRERLNSRSQAARQELAAAHQDAWSRLLAQNQSAFESLRVKAKSAPRGETPCTFCDGGGHMAFCFVCGKNSGKCVTCNGSGRDPANEPCPTCRGNGKCFYCRGTGKMPCAFCDDGMIRSKSPPPPSAMPIH